MSDTPIYDKLCQELEDQKLIEKNSAVFSSMAESFELTPFESDDRTLRSIRDGLLKLLLEFGARNQRTWLTSRGKGLDHFNSGFIAAVKLVQIYLSSTVKEE